MPQRISPRLDLSAIRFPTNRVTIAQMRSEQPGVFAEDYLRAEHLSDLNVVATIRIEIELAETAFAKALGLPEPRPHESQAGRVSRLNEDYKRYGISTGIQATRQLAREIETAAVEQAKRFRAR